MGNNELNSNETAILAAASRICSGMISTGKIDSKNIDSAINASLSTATKIAGKIDSSGKFEKSGLIEGEVPWPW